MLPDELLLEMYTDYPEVRQHMASVPKIKKRLFLTPSKLEMERYTDRYLVTLGEDTSVSLRSELLSRDEVVTCSNRREALNGTTFNKLFVESAMQIEGKEYTLLDLSFAAEVVLNLDHKEIMSDRYTDIARDIQICWPPLKSATLVRCKDIGYADTFGLSNADGICVQHVRDILQAPRDDGMVKDCTWNEILWAELRFIGGIEDYTLEDE